MVKKVKQLTQAQKDRMPEWVDKWTKIGLSTLPANRSQAEIGIDIIYHNAGLEKPLVIWCDSPLASMLARTAGDSLAPSIGQYARIPVWAAVKDSLAASIGNDTKISVWSAVKDSIEAPLWASIQVSVCAVIWDAVWAAVWIPMWAAVKDSLRASSVKASVYTSVWDFVYGQHEAAWLGFYDYCANVLMLHDETKPLEGLNLVAQNAGWFIPHENICWIAERHDICKVNANGLIDRKNAVMPLALAMGSINGYKGDY